MIAAASPPPVPRNHNHAQPTTVPPRPQRGRGVGGEGARPPKTPAPHSSYSHSIAQPTTGPPRPQRGRGVGGEGEKLPQNTRAPLFLLVLHRAAHHRPPLAPIGGEGSGVRGQLHPKHPPPPAIPFRVFCVFSGAPKPHTVPSQIATDLTRARNPEQPFRRRHPRHRSAPRSPSQLRVRQTRSRPPAQHAHRCGQQPLPPRRHS